MKIGSRDVDSIYSFDQLVSRIYLGISEIYSGETPILEFDPVDFTQILLGAYDDPTKRIYQDGNNDGWNSGYRSNFTISEGGMVSKDVGYQGGIGIDTAPNYSDFRQNRYFLGMSVNTFRVFEEGSNMGDFGISGVDSKQTWRIEYLQYPQYYQGAILRYTSLKANQGNGIIIYGAYSNTNRLYNPKYRLEA